MTAELTPWICWPVIVLALMQCDRTKSFPVNISYYSIAFSAYLVAVGESLVLVALTSGTVWVAFLAAHFIARSFAKS